MDGGSLLKTINWVKNIKFQQVAQLYINCVTKHFLVPGCTIKFVFDSYPSTPTTKDSIHLRRTRNSFNKQGLVSYLADKLNVVPGVLCSKADDDADCLIVLTPFEALVDNPDKALVGDDTDLIVLLLYHTQERLLYPGEPLFCTKKSTWDISLLFDSVKGQPFIQHNILKS